MWNDCGGPARPPHLPLPFHPTPDPHQGSGNSPSPFRVTITVMRRLGSLFVLLMLLVPAWGRAGQMARACAMAQQKMPCHRPIQPPCHPQKLPNCCVIEAPPAPLALTIAPAELKAPAPLFLIPSPGWTLVASESPLATAGRRSPAATPPPAPPPAHNLPLRI